LALPGRDVGYDELLGRVAACAIWLARERWQPSDVIGVTVAEEVPHLVTTLALLSLGIPQVTLPTYEPVLRRLALADRLAVSRVIVTDSRHALPGRDTLRLDPALTESASGTALPDALAADPEAPALYYTSSGTTGEPKIFAWSQRAMAWRAARIAEAERIGRGCRSLTPIPIEHALAKSKRLTCTYLGVTSVFSDHRSTPLESVPELCADCRVTNLEVSLLQVSSLALDARNHAALPPGIAVFSGGSHVPARLRRQFRARHGTPLFVNYGAREFGRMASTFPYAVDDLESVGIPVPWIVLEIVDEEGKALPRGEIGEIRVRSECMLREYYRDPVMTSRHFKDGWFYPHDLGSLTPDGALCLHGRTDEMMNLHGIKCFPAEIERMLEEHPAVRAAAAFAKTSAAHGEIPMAAVELRESASISADELLVRAREVLGVRAPRKVIVLEKLPRNAAGKIARQELAGLLANDH
jgi:acyl-coenzyme A synthetase/AMP-(fatty) acid ligase